MGSIFDVILLLNVYYYNVYYYIDCSYNFATIVQLAGQVIMHPFGQTEIKSPRTQPEA